MSRESYEQYMTRRLREEEEEKQRRAEYEDREWQRLMQLAESKKKIAELKARHDSKEPKIYESPDGGKTVYERDFGSTTRRLVSSPEEQKINDYLYEDKANKPDMVNHPPHYNKGIETTTYINSWDMGFSQGNVVKYVTRYNLKHDSKEKQLEDLRKARWYLEDVIKQVENE
jgi:hypothetical protein